MMKTCIGPGIGLLFTIATGQAGAQSLAADWQAFQQARETGVATTIVDIDNDSLLLNRKDGFYTSGVRLTRQFGPRDEAGAKATATSYGWRIGQQLYTNADIKLPPRPFGPPDHPYAGWLYGGVFRDTTAADGGSQRYGIDLGCLGPCAGGYRTQTTAHRILHQPLPQGWSSQVRNEPGVILYADLTPVRWQPASGVDLAPSMHARFGNIHTDLAGSLLARAGQLDAAPGLSSLYGFGRVEARAVGYDATLQGGYFSSGNPQVVSPRRLVGEVELGLHWQFDRLRFSASLVRTGNEIAGLSNAIGAQNIARLQLAIVP